MPHNVFMWLLHYSSLDVIFLQIVIPLLLLLRLLLRRLGCLVLSKQLSNSLLVLVRNSDWFLANTDYILLYLLASVYLSQLLFIKQLQFLQLPPILFFISMHEKNKFEVVNNILIHYEVTHKKLVQFVVVVIHLYHQ